MPPLRALVGESNNSRCPMTNPANRADLPVNGRASLLLEAHALPADQGLTGLDSGILYAFTVLTAHELQPQPARPG